MQPPPGPQLAIAASGEGTPFRLTLLRDGSTAKASVNGDALGKLTRHESSDHAGEEHVSERTPAYRCGIRGFTLVEVLVALMVVAMGLAALMIAVSSTARTSGYLRDKTLAQWMALNRLSEVRLNLNKFGQNTDTGEVYFANRTWHYDTRYFDTSITTMKRVVVRVYAGDAKTKGNPVAESTGFLGSCAHHSAWQFQQCGLEHRACRRPGQRRRCDHEPGYDAEHAHRPHRRQPSVPPNATRDSVSHRRRHEPAPVTPLGQRRLHLIEILVALLILGIMSALGYGTYRAARISAERTEESLQRSREIEFGMRMMVQDLARDGAAPRARSIGSDPAANPAGAARHGGRGHALCNSKLKLPVRVRARG